MGFFDWLLGRGERWSKSNLSPKVEVVFEKIRNFMLDEANQNNSYPPEIQQMMAAGGAVDEIPGGEGEFGRNIRNPIPVNGPIGELVYISNLALPGGCAIMGHCLGSINKIDAYETLALDGSKWDIFFFDPYHTRKSERLPSGYQANSYWQRFFLATNFLVPAFPSGMYEALHELTARVIGMPFVHPLLREENRLQGFSRPPGLLRDLESLRLHGPTQAPG
ncbi:MAG: hypothetical protein ABSA04_02050 [Desulfobaccales bacterium]|jgi:hypothetical protein